MKKPRVLILAFLPIEGDVVGGVKVSSQALVDQFNRSGAFQLDIINMSRPLRGSKALRRIWLDFQVFVMTSLRCFARIPRADVVFANFGLGGAPMVGLIWLLTRLFRKPMVLRYFGGYFHVVFQNKSWLAKLFAKWTYLRAEMILLQTRQQMDYFRWLPATAWFPTTRSLLPAPRVARNTPNRLLFMSHLQAEKGVHVALAAFERLPEDFSIDFYGPMKQGVTPALFEGKNRVRYCGVASKAQLPSVFAEHDVLILPTFFIGEGYPGVVLEALQCGLPVIASDWQALPEILAGERGGLLVETKSVDALVAAILRLRDEPGLYERLMAAALARGEDFRIEHWHRELEENLRALIAGDSPTWLGESRRNSAG